MITLAIETSSDLGSIAVHRDGSILFSKTFAAGRRNSAGLFIELMAARDSVDTFDSIVVGLGPGSYSGVRIAIATAIGLARATKATLLGIPSIATLECQEETYYVTGDARRESFYLARISSRTLQTDPELFPYSEAEQRLSGLTPLFATAPLSFFPGAVIRPPSAIILAQLAAENRGIRCRDMLDPIYLREPHITRPRM